jgi:hypothetical protein
MQVYDEAQAQADREQFAECDAATLVAQIGRMNVMAISGGRVIDSGHGVILPVSSGYKVTVDLAGNDTYTVRRIMFRGMKAWIKGERANVYCEEVGQAAYYASCFRSYDESEWTVQS